MNRFSLSRNFSHRAFRNIFLTLALLFLTTGIGGCTDELKGGPRLEVVPITGQVLVDGKPGKGVTVDFRRVSARGVEFPVPEPVGYTDEKGVILASTYLTNDGAGPGEYMLLFSKGETLNPFTGDMSGDIFKGRYSSYKNPPFPRVTVPAQLDGKLSFDVGTYELSTKKEE